VVETAARGARKLLISRVRTNDITPVIRRPLHACLEHSECKLIWCKVCIYEPQRRPPQSVRSWTYNITYIQD